LSPAGSVVDAEARFCTNRSVSGSRPKSCAASSSCSARAPPASRRCLKVDGSGACEVRRGSGVPCHDAARGMRHRRPSPRTISRIDPATGPPVLHKGRRALGRAQPLVAVAGVRRSAPTVSNRVFDSDPAVCSVDDRERVCLRAARQISATSFTRPLVHRRVSRRRLVLRGPGSSSMKGRRTSVAPERSATYAREAACRPYSSSRGASRRRARARARADDRGWRRARLRPRTRCRPGSPDKAPVACVLRRAAPAGAVRGRETRRPSAPARAETLVGVEHGPRTGPNESVVQKHERLDRVGTVFQSRLTRGLASFGGCREGFKLTSLALIFAAGVLLAGIIAAGGSAADTTTTAGPTPASTATTAVQVTNARVIRLPTPGTTTTSTTSDNGHAGLGLGAAGILAVGLIALTCLLARPGRRRGSLSADERPAPSRRRGGQLDGPGLGDRVPGGRLRRFASRRRGDACSASTGRTR